MRAKLLLVTAAAAAQKVVQLQLLLPAGLPHWDWRAKDGDHPPAPLRLRLGKIFQEFQSKNILENLKSEF